MALVRYGGGIVEMRGSIAGNTFARNRFGGYSRARTKPVNPRSSRQMGARVAVMYLAEQWRETPMDAAKRQAWETYANSVNWLNKLGEVVKLTGFNHYIRTNAALMRVNGTRVDDGPADLGLPGGDPVADVTAAKVAGPTIDLTFDDTMLWCDEDDAYFAIFMGEPQNPTRNSFAGPWRYCQRIAGDNAAPPVSPIPGIGPLPYTLVLGQKIWFAFHIIRADGRVSTKFECDPVIVEA